MTDDSFEVFVRDNIVEIDALSRRYAEFRMSLVDSYLKELKQKIFAATPSGYQFGEVAWSGVIPDAEQICGWHRVVEVACLRTAAWISFGLCVPAAVHAGGWPLMARSCWTGIKVGLSGNARAQVLTSARKISVESERPDKDWHLYRPWTPLAAATVSGLYDRITGEDRQRSQDEIVDDLKKWTVDWEAIINDISDAKAL